MAKIENQTVEVGDLFRDNDPRVQRVVKVLAVGSRYARVEVVEHERSRVIGRTSYISTERLRKGKNRQTGYTKVSH